MRGEVELSEAILTKKQLSSYIDRCIQALNSGDSTPIAELASLMQTLALATNDDVLLALPQSLGAFASEFARFKMLVAVPILDQEQRKNCTACVEKAAQEGSNGLKILQQELCSSSKRDYCNILNAMAIFSKHGYLMYTLRNQFTAVPSSGLFSEE